MSLLRTDEQVESQEILKQIIETADFHQAMAEYLDEEALGNTLADIARKRKTYIAPWQKLVKKLDELPAGPDPDREFVEEIGSKLSQLLSEDSIDAILERCLDKDAQLSELVESSGLGSESAEFRTLLDALSGNLAETRETLLGFKDSD